MLKVLKLCLASLLMASTSSMAATIVKLNIPKKTVNIDEGTNTGFQKKGKVCFYDGTSKLGCGFVKSSKLNSATIRIKSTKTMAKLKEGLEARLEIAGAKLATENSGSPDNPNAAPNYIKGLSAIPIISPVSHANLIYETPQGQPASSMWSVDGKSRVGGPALGLEAGIGIGSTTLALGLKARTKEFYSSKKIASDYDDKDADPEGYFEEFAETSSEDSSFGAYFDFYYYSFRWGLASLSIGNGLEFESSKVTFKMIQKNENDADATQILYKGSSALNAIFLKTNLMLDFSFGSFGFNFGTIISVPLSQSQKFKLDIDEDPFASNLENATVEEDAKKSLDHKASFAAELALGFHINL